MAAASVPSSLPIARTNLSPPSDPVCPFLSSWRWVSHGIPTGFSRLEAGAGLWNSKAQKVQRGVALLCLNLPPTTLFAFLFCQVLHAGDKKWETARAQMGVGEKNQKGGPRALCLQRLGEQNQETSRWALGNPKCLPFVSHGQVGMGRHKASEAGAHGLWHSCVLFSWAGSPEEVGGWVWRGEHLFGQWAQTWPYR